MNNLAFKLIKNYESKPDKICLIQNETQVNYANLYNMVSNFKKYLESIGIKKGQKVLILVPMSINFYVTLLAIWSIGAIPSFMDAGFIKNGVKKNEFDEIGAIIGISKYILYSNINKNLKKLKKVNVSIINKLNYNERLEIKEVDKDFPGILTYTSGTTGKPKIAERTHNFLKIQGEILEKNLDYESEDTEISTIPIFTLSNINVGITTVIADAKFSNLGQSNPKKIISQIIKNKSNRIMAAPGLLNVITDYCIEKNIILESINKIFTGGGAVFIDTIEKIKTVFPNSKIVTLYGSTEAEPISKLNVEEVTKQDIEKIENGYGILAGKIVGVEECEIIKANLKEIGKLTPEEFNNIKTDNVGEIVVTGENVLKGYVNGVGDKENKFSVEGKVFHRTGDLGFLDEFGRLWLRGRIKEPYFNIEAALHAKFDIGKTAVFNDDNKIILVLEQKGKISEENIKAAIKFAKIDDIRYVKKIPVDKRHSTKVDYKELRKNLKLDR